MRINKRSLPMYIFLNCITLGIYGFIVGNGVGTDINKLCKGDGEKPKASYALAVLFRAIPAIIGLTVGIIVGIVSVALITPWTTAEQNAEIIVLNMTAYTAIFGIIGSVISGIYHKFWWFKQASRLKLNGFRYGITVRESGVDNLIFRTLLEILFMPLTVVLLALSLLFPMFMIWLVSLIEGSGLLVEILLFLVLAIYLFFGSELTVGSCFATGIVFKNLNRYADVCHNGPERFDPMGYEYYPSHESKYPNYLPEMINPTPEPVVEQVYVQENVVDNRSYDTAYNGTLICTKGSGAGYKYELHAGEEIIIGKDPKVAMVVIEAAYREVSRKHLGVRFDSVTGQYCVVDYSSNGTWANGVKMVRGQLTYLPSGTELKLANGKVVFRLG